jgi:hypothetical protein
VKVKRRITRKGVGLNRIWKGREGKEDKKKRDEKGRG